MKLQLNISNAEYIEAHKEASENQTNSILSERLASITLLKELIYFQEYGKKLSEIGDAPEKISQILKDKKGIFIFYDKSPLDARYKLTVSAFKHNFNWQFEIQIKNNGGISTEVDLLITCFKEFYRATELEISIGLVSSIRIVEIEYPSPKPPKFWRFYDKWALVDIVNFPALDIQFEDLIKITNKLAEGKLPPKVAYEKFGDNIFIINWLPLLNSSDYRSLLRYRAEWFSDNSDFILDPSFNLYGDSLFVTVSLVRDKYFTFVDNFTGIAFKAIVPNLETRKNLHKMLKEIISHKTDKITGLYLIAPNRGAAVDVMQKVLDLDLSGVLYVDDEGQFWAPQKD